MRRVIWPSLELELFMILESSVELKMIILKIVAPIAFPLMQV